MLVSRSSLESVLEELRAQPVLSLDVESTGLRPYHEDRIFSLILAYRRQGDIVSHYFNFQPYPDLPEEQILPLADLDRLRPVLEDPTKKFYIHNSSFDLHMLQAHGIEVRGEVFCTLVQGRVEYNEHTSYSLDASLKRIGLAKDSAVETWIAENQAFEQVDVPGKKTRVKNLHYWKVPHEIIVPYGCADAAGCLALGEHLERSLETQAKDFPSGVPDLLSSSRIERRLAHTVHRMERVGIKIDRPYVHRALAYEADRLEKATQAFVRETGRPYAASPKLFADIFQSERDRWSFTDKGNPSFESDTLKTFENPAAKAVLTLRDAKSKLDFYHGFLWHADDQDVIHPHFKSTGTRTFRFSSSEPNLQNLTSEDATYCRGCGEWSEQYLEICPLCDSSDTEHPEFMVRRAFIPRPGFLFIMPDYDQMEYKLLLEYAKQMMVQELNRRGQNWDEGYFEVANRVRDGFDVHRATAEMLGISRKFAKTINFGLLYGQGVGALAVSLGVSVQEAGALRDKYFRALPYVQYMIKAITDTVKTRGWIRNWAGYKYTFPDRNYAYTGPNTVIQGGCAAVVKMAMNEIDELLLPYKSRMVLTIHDETPCEISEDEVSTVPRLIKDAMERVYPHKHVPLTAGMEYSTTSLADKKKGFPA